MTSNYSSDPRVPAARVEHLGKHHKTTPHGPVGLPSAHPGRRDEADAGPTYEDFLEHDGSAADEVPDKTG